MKLLKPGLFMLLAFAALQSFAQNSKWFSYQFSKKVSFQTAAIRINNKPATYSDLLKIGDSSILKIEVYSKKAAQAFIDKEDAANGLVQVTLRKKNIINYPPKKDSIIYIINDNGDTVVCNKAIPATINGDTLNVEWIRFLQKSLKSQVPANNGAPPGVYMVDVVFLVKKDGSIAEISVAEDPGYGTAAEVKRLMANSPLWKPAMCNESPVNFRQKERIVFVVTE